MTHPLRSVLLAVAAVLTSAPAWAQQPLAAPAPPAQKPLVGEIEFKDGDTLVFLGDSITHQCLYTQYVEDYFFTRYPKLRLHFHNAGVGGDRAANALQRFDEDVAAWKPRYVTVLLGMNDGGYKGYDQGIFDAYQRDMAAVLDRIAAIGATAIPMTPTMHDARAARLANHTQEPRDTYYNGVLALYGAWLREQAQVRGLGFVDMYSPLNNLTLEQRAKDPKWTMIQDAVHPGPTGQVVMAAAVIADMAPRSRVSLISIDGDLGDHPQHVQGGTIGTVKKEGRTLSFTFTAAALPWVLPPDASEGFKLVTAGHRFSNEKLIVRHLPPGRYELQIDRAPVGAYSSAQLAAGVELERNEKTPEYQQALNVALLNKARNEQAVHPLRDQWGALKGKRNDLNKALGENAPDLATRKEAFEKWLGEFQPRVDALIAKVKEFDDQIYQANQPAPHRYELSPAQ